VKIRFPNTSHLTFLSYLPSGLQESGIFKGLRDVLLMHHDTPLNVYFDVKKPRLILAVYGSGTPDGIVCGCTQDLKSTCFIPTAWWAGPPGKEIHVFVFACNSAEYLRGIGAMHSFHGAMGYKGKLWLYVDAEDKGLCRFWRRFLRLLSSVFRNEGKIDSDTFMRVSALYTSNYRRGSVLGTFGLRRAVPNYMARICLRQQMESLELVAGKGAINE